MTRTRSLIISMVLTVMAAVIAGCGSTNYGTSNASKADAKPIKLRAVTPPTASAKLTKELDAAGAALTTAGCAFGTYPEEEALHVDNVDDLKFTSFPPSSGTHFPIWATPGVYDQAIGDGFAVHNLEHGGVTAWLGTDVDKATAKLVDELPDKGQKWLVSPRSDLAGLFSAAWGKGLSCPPSALTQLTPEALSDGLEAWYDAVNSTGSEAEKDVPSYAGSMKEPTPTRDISEAASF